MIGRLLYQLINEGKHNQSEIFKCVYPKIRIRGLTRILKSEKRQSILG
jgi:hypothetical protein